jgi:signal transduction histidine kinase
MKFPAEFPVDHPGYRDSAAPARPPLAPLAWCQALLGDHPDGVAYCRIVKHGATACDFAYLWTNPAFTALTGLAPTPGQRVSTLIPGLLQAEPWLLETYARVAAGGGAERFESHVPRLDAWFSVQVSSPRAGDFLAMFEIVSARKSIEARLRDSEALLNQAEDIAQLGSWDYDCRSGTLTWSDGMYRLYGRDRRAAPVDRANVLDTVPRSDQALIRAAFAAARAGAPLDLQHRVVPPGGSARVLRVRGVLHRDASGAPEHLTGSAQDVSVAVAREAELLAARAELEQRVEARTRQLRELAIRATLGEDGERQAIARDLHDDLGQLLHVARLRLDALGRPDALPASAHAAVAELKDIIAEASRRVRSLTSQLSPPVLHDLGLEPTLRWLAEEMQRIYGLAVVAATEPLPHPLEPSRAIILFRAARELLINVARHADADVARLALSCRAGVLTLEVADDGVGMAGGDPGFGMSSIRERIAFLGGRVDVSASPQGGTRVVLTLPVDGPNGAAA